MLVARIWPLSLLLVATLVASLACRRSENSGEALRPVTFTKDIAPIVFQNCATCHRRGQSAPFTLTTFADVKKHAADIAKVTARGYMPPWLPDARYGDFLGARRLRTNQIALLQRWVAEGAIEGAAADLPPLPDFPSNWPLGPPDLVVTFNQPYALAAEGRDLYRNFVVPLGLT